MRTTPPLTSQFAPSSFPAMTESEYKQLAEFQDLPVYDAGDPLCDTVADPDKEDPERTTWLATLYQAEDLETAREFLQQGLVPRGGIRYWDGDRKNCSIFAHFWEKRPTPSQQPGS